MKKHILVCEDDDSILEVLQMILEEKGYQVTALSYLDSVQTVERLRPDLVLIDLWFPEMGGIELCKQMKAHPELRNTPIILVSATNELDKTAKKLKANDFIRKPFNVNEVVEKVGKHVSS